MKRLDFFNRIFPRKYDFYNLLKEQSKTNFLLIKAMEKWVIDHDDLSYNEVFLRKNEE